MRGGRIIVRGLDGSTNRATATDPVKDDFPARFAEALVSPAGDLEARRWGNFPDCGFVVARPDGSDRRVLHLSRVTGYCPYAMATWSPDGRKLLVMFDVSGFHFTMYAVSVYAPFETVTVVGRVGVNHGRSWPGRGDVSWQPRPS